MAKTRITLEETNDFATALRVRRLAIGMDPATLRTFLDRTYTAAQIDRWEAGTSEPSTEEKAVILASLARVQNALLYEYEKITTNITHRHFPEMAEKLPLVAYRQLLKMLHVRLGLPVVTMNAATEQEEIFS
nr:MAG TPA: protein of unknown function (DUF1870) [Caudoviricetes sp.]